MHRHKHTSPPPAHVLFPPLRRLIKGWTSYLILLGLLTFSSLSPASAQMPAVKAATSSSNALPRSASMGVW